MTVGELESIRKRVTVEVSRDRAFTAFASQMGSWWNPGHHIGGAPFADVVLEPHAGGAWYEVDADGARCAWGQVLAWEPPGRLLLNWQISAQWAHDPDLLTELEVTFTALSATSTLVELEHRLLENLGEDAPAIRAQFDDPGGWQGLLDRFAETV